MKKIVKTDGIITNAFGPNAKVADPKLRNPKTAILVFVNVKIDGKFITSENSISVPSYRKNGDHISVWYVKGKNKKVFSNPIAAFLFG